MALPNNSTAAVVHIQKDLLVSDSAPDVQRFRRVRAPVKLKRKQRAHLSATTLEFRAPRRQTSFTPYWPPPDVPSCEIRGLDELVRILL